MINFRKLTLIMVTILFAVTIVAGCSGPEAKKMKFYNKGKALYEKGDFVKANLEFKNAIQIDPKFADSYYMIGMVSMKTGNFNSAFGNFSKAADLDPNHVKAQVEIGKLYLLGKAPDKAMEKAELVLKTDPKNEDAHLLKAAVFLIRKEYDKTLTYLDESDKGRYYKTRSVYAPVCRVSSER